MILFRTVDTHRT